MATTLRPRMKSSLAAAQQQLAVARADQRHYAALNDYARIITGLPRDWTFGDKSDFRHRATERITFELLSDLSDHLTSRLQVAANHVVREDAGGMGAAIAGFSTTRNPNTSITRMAAASHRQSRPSRSASAIS